MNILDIPVPAVYREESADFRFFQKWFQVALSKVQYDTEEFFDLFDPLRCPEPLLWMLGDTMGYKYDPRLSTAFNRLVLVYFMSMIRLKGSKDGVTLSAQVNLDQFHLQDEAEQNHILNNRLDDTSIPSNSVYVEPNVEKGYIDLVYFSDELPVDACLEYTRPVGMYLVPHAGVRYDAKTRLTIDARLTDTRDLNISIGSTHVGHYSKDDYSRMQRLELSDLDEDGNVKNTEGKPRYQRDSVVYEKLSDTRQPVWYRNSKYEIEPKAYINPGYRALYSLQLVNGDAVTRSLLRNTDSVNNLTVDDVGTFDINGNVQTQADYVAQRSAQNTLDYVENAPVASLGDAMVTTSENTSEGDQEDD